ncbi:MAG: AAA family ATPase [Actinomycetota bacterium]|nr:AAA family ATPase [Actinomycetota bacterium]
MAGAGLLDREKELAELRSRVTDLAAGRRPGGFGLTGRCGVGLTALLQAGAHHATLCGVLTASATCTPAESGLAFGVVSQLAAELYAAGHPLPDQALWTQTASAATDAAVCAGFLAVARNRPLMILVDDAHWADDHSRQWLHALALRARHTPLLVICAGADGGPPSLPGPVVSVQPLGYEAVRRIAEDTCGTADRAFATAAAAATGGRPAVLRPALDRFAGLGVPATGAHLDDLLAQIQLVLGERAAVVLGRLPADALGLARAMAVCGDALEPELVAAVAGTDAGVSARTVDLLVGLGLVEPADRPSLAGPAVTARVLAGMTAGGRAELAGAAAKLGHRAAIDDDRLAGLVLHAPPLGERWAVDVLCRTAERRRAAGAVYEARKLLLRALVENGAADAAHLLTELALTEVATNPAGSDRRLHQVLLEATPETPDDVLLRTADLLLARGDARAVHRSVATAVRRRGGPPALIAIGRLAGEDSVAEPALPVPELPDRPDDAGAAGFTAWRLARAGVARSRARRLARLALQAGDNAPFTPRMYAARALRLAGDLVEAVRGLTAVIHESRRAGARAPAALALTERAMCELVRGNLSRADEDAEAALAELPARSWHPALLPRLVVVAAARHLARGDADAAARALETELPAGAAAGAAWGCLQYVRGGLRMALADPAGALPYFLDCGRSLTARGFSNPAGPAWRSMAAAAYASMGDLRAAVPLVADAVGRAEAWGAVAIRRQVHAIAARAGIPDAAGHHAAAIELLPPDHRRSLPAYDPVPEGVTAPALGLTAEDHRLATLVAAGWPNPTLAGFLGVSTRTVEARLTALYRRLGLAGRDALAERIPPPGWRGDVRYDADCWLLRTPPLPERSGRER